MDVIVIIVSGILLGGIYALVAIGLNLVLGVVRVVNFAHGELVMLGMFAAYFFSRTWHLDPYLSSFVLIAPAGFVIGVLIQRFIIQRLLDEPLMQMFATFGLLILLENVALALTRGEPRTVRTAASSAALDLYGVSVNVPRLIVLGIAILLTAGLVTFLRRTLAGAAIRAVSQDRATAALMGINVRRTYVLVFGISAALAGMAGGLLSPVYTATPSIGFSFVLPAFAVVVLGGLGSITGSLVGGVLVGVVEAVSGYLLDPSLKQAVWFSLFLAVLVIKPAGLFGQVGAEEFGKA